MSKKEIICKTKWFTLESEEYKNLPILGGKPFYRIRMSDTIAVLAITKEGKVVFVRQFRPATNRYTLELPAGYIEKGEASEKAAARELYEETGYRCPKLHFLGVRSHGVDRIKDAAFVYFGRGASRNKNFSKEDGVEVVPLTLKEVRKIAKSGTPMGMFSFGIILLAKWLLNPKELRDL